MKNVSIFSTALLVLAALFISQTAQAQWTSNTNGIFQQDLTKKVGIGLNNPSYILHVNGKSGIKASSLTNLTSGGVLELQNTDNSNFLTLDGNKIQAAKYTSNFMVQANALLLNPYLGGSVGIGATNPAEARLVVNGAVNQTVAMFGQGAPGISLTNGWPGVGFNAYVGKNASNTLVWKAMSAGFGMRFECDPTSGRVTLMQHGNTPADGIITQTNIPLVIDPSGNVGFGVNTPGSKLDIAAQNGLRVQGFEPFITIQDNNSNKMARIQAAHGDLAFFKMDVGQTVATPQMVIKDNGNVLVGTSNDFGYKLAVNGTIRAKEIRVQTGWADYVFADDYQLRPLEEVERFIQDNKHLPDIQPAKEIQENGLDMAATTTKMMAKIEELTLYLIDLKKENDLLKVRVAQLEQQ